MTTTEFEAEAVRVEWSTEWYVEVTNGDTWYNFMACGYLTREEAEASGIEQAKKAHR